MLRAIAVAVVMLVGCTDDEITPVDQPRGKTGLEWCDSNDACTLAVPVGSSCSAEVTPFCADGRGWCSEDETCQLICSPVGERCPAGMSTQFEYVAKTNSDVCFCVAD